MQGAINLTKNHFERYKNNYRPTETSTRPNKLNYRSSTNDKFVIEITQKPVNQSLYNSGYTKVHLLLTLYYLKLYYLK